MADFFGFLVTRKGLFCCVSGIAVLFGGIAGLRSWNARMTPEKIAAGKVLFEHEWQVNDKLSNGGDGLGPVFNARSCVACHSQGGVGGSGGNEFNVTAFEVKPGDVRSDFVNHVVHADSVDSRKETKENVLRMFPLLTTILEIVNPDRSYGGGGNPGCGDVPSPASRPETVSVVVRENPVTFHELNSPQLFGVGLIDQMSDLSISMHGTQRAANRIADEFSGKFFNSNGIGNTRLAKGGIGKFGWKGQFASLEDFVASACAMEMGLSNSKFSQPVPLQHVEDHEAKMDMTRQQLHELVCFVRSLPAPEQVLPTDPNLLKRVNYGEQLFGEIGCTDCHVKDMGGVEGVYSDFHLYNLEEISTDGPQYSGDKNEAKFDFNRSHPHPDQWQTPPLWGVADSAPYMHDGASSTLEKAILRHKGQASYSRKRFKKLSQDQQDVIIEFLNTLRAPQAVKPSELTQR